MFFIHSFSTLSTSAGVALTQLAYAIRVRAERVAVSPMCCRCGGDLSLVERRRGQQRCYDCDVLAVLNNHTLVHDYGVTQMVKASA